jgi:hypothetical protein
MKLRLFRFTPGQGELLAYLRGHLLWMELPDCQTLKLGFSSESVVITGENLHLLMRDIVTDKEQSIHVMPPQHKTDDHWFVNKIETQEHAQNVSPPTAFPAPKA